MSSSVNGFFRSPTVTVRSHSLEHLGTTSGAMEPVEPDPGLICTEHRGIVASCSHMCCFCARFHSPQAIATIGTIQCRIHQMKQDGHRLRHRLRHRLFIVLSSTSTGALEGDGSPGSPGSAEPEDWQRRGSCWRSMRRADCCWTCPSSKNLGKDAGK